jgi:asparagine synthase (glutamine-hydrolysing)
MSEPGGFAVLGVKDRKLVAFRDPNGLKPLYFGKHDGVTAFASERKALWRIGFKEAKRLNPGTLYAISNRQVATRPIAQFKRPLERHLAFDQARSELLRALIHSVKQLTHGLSKVAVAFSGGLDSSVTAVLARSLTNVELVSVGLSDSPELQTAEKYANELDLPITREAFSADELESYVRRVVWLIEEPNLMKVSVAVPLHWAATVASKKTHAVMLCGQGSDELYGGYYKYTRILDTKGRTELRRQLFRCVVEAAEINYERDEQATAPAGVELRTPFADLGVIRFSLAIPSEFKVKDGNDVTRKWILRAVARDLGVPESIVWRRKKAIQHGTGVEHAIIKLAKSRNLSAHSYLEQIFKDVRNMNTMP